MLGLLADIGGTYARLQLVDLSKNPYTIVVAQTYKSCNYPNLPSLLRYFLTQSGCEKSPEMACLAVAGPVAQGRAVLTNLCWEISESQLIDELGCKQARLINDVAASALVIDALEAADVSVLHQGAGHKYGPRLVVNIGTGYGQALLLTDHGKKKVLASEAGHADFYPADEFAMGLITHLLKHTDSVTVETILSGPGLLRLFNYINNIQINNSQDIISTPPLNTANIIQLANEGDQCAVTTLNQFVNLLALQLVNAALSYMPTGGIYLVGGLSLALKNYWQGTSFSQAVSRKPAMGCWLEKIPIKLVLNDNTGLLGAGSMVQAMCENRLLGTDRCD